MYKFKREKQISFTDFNQPQGMMMTIMMVMPILLIIMTTQIHLKMPEH